MEEMCLSVVLKTPPGCKLAVGSRLGDEDKWEETRGGRDDYHGHVRCTCK